jgi:transposase
VDAVRAGDSVAVVARVLNPSPRAIFKWLERYRLGGYATLREGQRSGRKRKVDSALLRWLYAAITQHDPRQYQFPFCLWTLGVVRTLLNRYPGGIEATGKKPRQTSRPISGASWSKH